MVQNVEQILSRGERIELLVDKTDAMAGQANTFRRGARATRRQMWWKNTRVLVLCFFVAIVSFLYPTSSASANQVGVRFSCGSLRRSSVGRD
jgi:vesicle-associated membrane protein 7